MLPIQALFLVLKQTLLVKCYWINEEVHCNQSINQSKIFIVAWVVKTTAKSTIES